MIFHKLPEANKLNLARLTQWCEDTPENRKYLVSTASQVKKDPTRKTMFIKVDGWVVKAEGTRIALFVDNIASTVKTSGPISRKLSRTGKFKSIRHFAEYLFSKNPALSVFKFKHEMSKEYPRSEAAGFKCYNHFLWYRHHLVVNGRFKCMPVPVWFKKQQ